MAIRTLAALRSAAKSRADMVSSTFVTDPEWLTFLNGSAAWLYGLLVEKFEDYNVQPFTITTDGTNDRYALPTDFFKLRAVDLQASGTPTGWVTLRPFALAERNRISRVTAGVTNTLLSSYRYRIGGSNLWLAPMPQAGKVVRLYYTPQVTELSSDADTLDGVNGWEELVVLDAARKALLKEESDTSGVEREIAVLVQRIEHEAANRDAGEPPTVADVERGGQALNDFPWSY